MAGNPRMIGGILAALAALLLPVASGASDRESSIEDFFGTYVGSARIEGADYGRDIIVAIEPARKGFSIYTSTVIRKGPERAVSGVKWRAETQNFVLSDMPHVYTPLLRASMFAKRRNPDLVGGDTVAWASIRGKILGIYAMDVMEDGHYELRVFERTLTELGVDLSFTRYKDGVAVRGLQGILARTGKD